MPRKTTEQRIKEKIVIDNNNCWVWTGRVNNVGYGEFSLNGKNFRVHRASYLLYKGEIPDKMLVCHTCDVRRCVNPDHLWLGTHQDNTDDAVAKGRIKRLPPRIKKGHRRGSGHFLAKLTEDDVREMRALYAKGGWTHKQLGEKYNVNRVAITLILNGKNWAHVM